MMLTRLSLSFAIPFVVSFLLTPVCRSAGRALGFLDVPNSRSSHTVPTPRNGGLAIVAGMMSILFQPAVFSHQAFMYLASAMLLMALLGSVDDFFGLSAQVRLVVHISLAALLLWGSRDLLPSGIWWVAGGLVWLVGVTNAYNFMDGIDGLAASEGVIESAVLAILFFQSGDPIALAAALAIGGACLGFLPWNFPSGSIFMGDVGSATIGFGLAALVLRAGFDGISPVAAVLPLLPFLLDAGITLLRRISRKERLFQAHRTHFYQRLVKRGWSHPQVTGLWSALALAAAVASVSWNHLTPAGRIVAVAIVLLFHSVVFTATWASAGADEL